MRRIATGLASLDGALLPVLHEVNDGLGWVSDEDVAVVADVLNLSRAEVHGVLTFYSDFRRSPAPTHRVALCRGEACQALGSEPLHSHAVAALAGRPDVELGEVFCLGNCALGPSALVDGRLRGRLTPDALVAAFDEAPAAATALQPSATGQGEPVTVYIPADASARAVGADAVAAAFSAEPSVTVVRTGSRGMLWLEPLVEVQTAAGRRGYANVAASAVPSILAGTAESVGVLDADPWLAGQRRVTFARVGVVDPMSLADYRSRGGMAGLARALTLPSAEVVEEVVASGLRGRGGAGFPTGVKWRTVLGAASDVKYICANADEGDSGTFADRMLMEGDPFSLIEGMLIAGHAVDARTGFIYLRSEYPDARAVLQRAIEVAYAEGALGPDALGPGIGFDLHLRVGAGAYICGEETSMLESLEGRRGEVRAKPPIPALEGLFGQPTVVNNVLTLATVPMVLADGGAAYAALGTDRSRGTQVFQLGGNVARGGIVEAEFGLTVRELVEGYGGGTRSGRPVRAVQIGGPLGAYLPADQLDLPLDYESLAAAGAMLGHGGVVVFDDTVDMSAQARFAMEFCAKESCGKCTPCRIGSTRGVEVIDAIRAGVERDANLVLLEDLCETMTKGSLCAMGGLTPMPVRSAITHFPEDFGIDIPVQTGGPR